MTVPQNLKYTKTHEWVKQESDGSITVGITDHAQSLLGDMVYIELPQLKEVARQKEICVVESVKAAADVYSPVSGTVIEVNQKAADDPAIVNQDPYGDGWLFKIKPTSPSELDELISAEDYQRQLADH